MLGLVSRATRDVDVIAMRQPDSGLIDPRPIPPGILESAEIDREALNLPADWRNAKVADGDLIRLGLPVGFSTRLHKRRFGNNLTVWLVDRADIIPLKLHAAADHGGGRHLSDLQALKPDAGEIFTDAQWAMTQDPSPGFKYILKDLLHQMGHSDVSNRL